VSAETPSRAGAQPDAPSGPQLAGRHPEDGGDGGAGRLQLGAHTLLYRAYPFERALEGIARAGFRNVGIWYGHAGERIVPPDASFGVQDRVRRRIESFGLRPRMTFAYPFVPEDAPGGEGERLQRTVEIAAGLGAEFVISAGPSPYAGKTFGPRKRDMLFLRQAEAYFAALRQVAPVAERLGVTVVLKPHMGVTGTGADLADLVERIGHPHVRVCYDAGNVAFYEGLEPERDVEDCARYVRAICVKDHRGPREQVDFPVPGQGDVDHAAVFRVLLGAGFAGPCLVERIDGLTGPETVDAALVAARAALESAAAEAHG
jgi:sugar phosphate isomerase/epimerase